MTWANCCWKNRYIRRGIEILAVLSAVNLLSLASGLVQGYGNQVLLSILMIIRKFEYFAFVLIGAYAVRRRKMKDPYRTFMNEFTVMSLLPKDADYYFTQASSKRAIPAEEVARIGAEHGLRGKRYATVAEAYQAALSDAGSDDFIFVGGSSYVVADLLAECRSVGV